MMISVNRNSFQVFIFGSALVFGLLALPVFAFSTEMPAAGADSVSTLQSAPNEPASINYGAALIRTVVSLVVVVFLLVAVILGIRWLQRKSVLGRAGTEVLGIVGSLSLGPKRNVTLIKVADRVLVVGSFEAGLSLLTELSREEAAAVLSAKGKSTGSFASTLASHLSQIGRSKS